MHKVRIVLTQISSIEPAGVIVLPFFELNRSLSGDRQVRGKRRSPVRRSLYLRVDRSLLQTCFQQLSTASPRRQDKPGHSRKFHVRAATAFANSTGAFETTVKQYGAARAGCTGAADWFEGDLDLALTC